MLEVSSVARGGPVLVTGATGFVGQRLLRALRRKGVAVRALSRSPQASETDPGVEWLVGDIHDPAALARALDGCRAAFYLVHAVGESATYDRDERASAEGFARAVAAAGLERVIYLGGVRPEGAPSRHLQSRLDVGERLRQGPVPCLELRAAMIVGLGSVSWTMVRELAGRLPAMLLPSWLDCRSQPVAIDDVIAALLRGLDLPLPASTFWDLAGPDLLMGRQILLQTAQLLGHRPLLLRVPFVTPRLSSYWISLVTRVPTALARELVEGLRSDLLPARPGFFEAAALTPAMPFLEAARRALREELGGPAA